MPKKILTWYQPSINGDGTGYGPAYYMDDDYYPVAVRIHTKVAPQAGDLLLDVKDDGVSIFRQELVTTVQPVRTESHLEYHNLATSTFRVNEVVTGGTSGAKGTVLADNAIGTMTLRHTTTGTAFSKDETITGDASSATGVVDNFVLGTLTETINTISLIPGAQMAKGDSSLDMIDDEDDFASGVMLEAGSWVTLDIVESGGASGITVQLEIDTMSDD